MAGEGSAADLPGHIRDLEERLAEAEETHESKCGGLNDCSSGN